ncbi:MAG TPA: apolipoprotein N-acyltransferase [Burkholderiales bacterium]|nr:apolipoprotein N-acyltransferase [Burkholderiales bacterium]
MKDEYKPSRGTFIVLHPSSLILALLSGALTVLGFAPFHFTALPLITLALLFWQWSKAGTPRQAFRIGWAFGLGFFLAGVSWIYVSLHTFGAMPMPLAALATLLFCAFLALFPATAGYVVTYSRRSADIKLMLIAPACWVLIEWVRSWIFTGFPWNTIGYTQIPGSPFAGFAPALGIYGVSLAATVIAGCITVLAMRWRENKTLSRPAAVIVISLTVCGFALKQIEWTAPAGAPTTVSLIQGNIAQDMKWRDDQMRATLDIYARLIATSNAQLIVLPETALPLFLNQVPRDYLDALAAHAAKNKGDVLFGVPEREPDGAYYNTTVSVGSSPAQAYRKSHLVPFGEFIPLRPALAWIVNILAIPLQDFSRGAVDQQPLNVAGQRVAVNICYEDVFGEEIIRQLPQATLLVNMSNVAWFGRSIAPAQHLQISQARALETGRYMLRATNTGMTAVIDPHGKVERVAPQFETMVLTHTVRGYEGVTPYVRWGNYAVLILLVIFLGLAWRLPAQTGDPPPNST